MMTKSKRILISLFLPAAVLLMLALLSILPAAQTFSHPKVDAALWPAMSTGPVFAAEEVEFIVLFEEQADLSHASAIDDPAARADFVVSALQSTAADQSTTFFEELGSVEIVKQLWVINGVVLRGDPSALELIAQDERVGFVYANPLSQIDGNVDEPNVVDPSTLSAQVANQSGLTWGIDLIDAEKVWDAGVTGEGVVVGGQDTGYDWEHPALKNQYRGYDADSETVDHAYSWHDSIREDFGTNGNQCGFDIDESCDDGYHGTHTMGTMVGQAPGFDIGVAPGADWVGCRNMEEGFGKPSTYIECFEWFLAPTDLNDENPDPSMAPHVINNSWGCPPIEGCNTANFDLMDQVVDNLRAAGVVVVVSAGNAGSGCGTVDDPAAIFSGSFSVGATNSDDSIASFSSRGPVTVDGSDRMKPNVTAPGVGVWSAIPPNSYSTLNGTSMAAPHVAGVVALMISADPSLAGQVEEIESIIEETAVPLTTNQTCGSDTATSIPNNVYGHGRVDAYAAYQRSMEKAGRHLHLEKTVPLDRLLLSSGVTETRQLSLELSVENRHPISEVVNIVLTETLPISSQLIMATGSYTYDEMANVVQWQIPALQPGERYTATLEIELTLNASITDTVELPATSARSSDIQPVSTAASQIDLIEATSRTFLPFLNPPELSKR